MPTKIRTAESHVKLAAPELPAGIRSGGENHPLEYPHLYQIQAGDWRISYAVEHNRLAILVLEVLKADGESSKDPAGEKMTRKMKIKLLDWPEGSGNAQVPAEEISKKMKIKWLDMSQEGDESMFEEVEGRIPDKCDDGQAADQGIKEESAQVGCQGDPGQSRTTRRLR